MLKSLTRVSVKDQMGYHHPIVDSPYCPQRLVNFHYINYVTRCIETGDIEKYNEWDYDDDRSKISPTIGLITFFMKLAKHHKQEHFYLEFYNMISRVFRTKTNSEVNLLDYHPRIKALYLAERKLVRLVIPHLPNGGLDYTHQKVITPLSPDFKKVRFNPKPEIHHYTSRPPDHPDSVCATCESDPHIIYPCRHLGFCSKCAQVGEFCPHPFCNEQILTTMPKTMFDMLNS